jgi:hypothetical protein
MSCSALGIDSTMGGVLADPGIKHLVNPYGERGGPACARIVETTEIQRTAVYHHLDEAAAVCVTAWGMPL